MEPRQLELPSPTTQLELALEFQPPTRYRLGIYESPLQWSGEYVRVALVDQTDENMRVRLQQDYLPFAHAGTEFEVRLTGFPQALKMTLPEIVRDQSNWTSSLWTLEGQFVGYGILGTKEKMKDTMNRTS